MPRLNAAMPSIPLVTLCVGVGVLLLLHAGPVRASLKPWWCGINISENRRVELADSLLEEIFHIDSFGKSLLRSIPGLMNVSYCDNVIANFPRSPVADVDTDLLQIPNAFWNLSVLQFAYRSLFWQWRAGLSHLNKQYEAHLEMFGILLDHSYGSIELNMQADRCSCGDDNCTLNYPTNETWEKVTRLLNPSSWPRCCNLLRFLGRIIARVIQTLSTVKRNVAQLHFSNRDEIGSAWYMCKVKKTIPNDSCAVWTCCILDLIHLHSVHISSLWPYTFGLGTLYTSFHYFQALTIDNIWFLRSISSQIC